MRNPGRLLFGIGLLVLGVLFLLDLGDYLDAWSVVGSLWPLVLVGVGLLALIGPSRSKIGGWIAVVVGVLLLAASLDLIPVSTGELFLPLILIAVGLGLILARSGVVPTGESGDRINSMSMFGGQTTTVRSESFTGGSVVSVFGGTDLDLRSATISPEGAGIDTFTMFGATNVAVPRGWRVTVSGIPIFGAFEDNIDRSVPPEPGAPHITVTGVVLFGGVEVSHEVD